MKGKVLCMTLLFFAVVMTESVSAEWEPNYGTQFTFSDHWKHHIGDWSSDGKWITIEIKGPVNGIVLFPLDGGEPVNLLNQSPDGRPLFPKFTSNSKDVYFSNFLGFNNINIESINIETREITVVLENAFHGYWSHNDRYLVHVKLGNPERVVVYDKETGNIWDLAEEPSNIGVHSCFSPDDSHIITTLGDKGKRYLYKIPLEGGEPEQLTFEEGEDFYPRYSPDGKWILYKHFYKTQFQNNNLMETRVYNTETGETKCLFPELTRISLWDFGAMLSPDGSKICYSRFSYTSCNQLFIADFQPERTWEPHFEVIPYETKSVALIIIPFENAPTINGEPVEIGDEIAVFTPRNVCAGMGVWAGETLAIDVWGDEYFKEGTLGFKRDEPYTFKIWDASEQRELPAEATYLDEKVEGSKTKDVYSIKGYCKLASLTAVSEPTSVDNGEIPETFMLSQNYPNPFNPVTTLHYQLGQTCMVNLVIYDLLGRKVTTLVDEMKTPGSYEATWNAKDYSSGVYFYRIEAGDSKVMTQKMLLVK